MQSLIWVSRG